MKPPDGLTPKDVELWNREEQSRETWGLERETEFNALLRRIAALRTDLAKIRDGHGYPSILAGITLTAEQNRTNHFGSQEPVSIYK